MDGEGYAERPMTRGRFLKRLLVLGMLSGTAYHVATPEYTPTADEVYARDILKDEKAWEERDGIFVSGEGDVENIDGSKADYRVATDIINNFLIALARRDGVENALTMYLAQNPLYILLDRPESVVKHEDWAAENSSTLASFLPAEGKSLMVISKLFFDLYNQTDRKSDLVDMVFAHELHHLFQYVKGEGEKMRRNTQLLDDAANATGFALAHEVIGGIGASNPVTTRRAVLQGVIGYVGMTAAGSVSRRFLGGTNTLMERDAYTETAKLTGSEFFTQFKGKFLKVTDVS